MKKTLLASSLAVAIGATGVAAHTTDAHASEATQSSIDQAQLAQKALNNDQSLNESPIQAGAYDYNFTYEGTNFHFWSDGTQFGWSYDGFGGQTASEQTSVAQPAQIQDVASQASTQSESNTAASTTQQASSEAPAATEAPKTTQTSTSGSGVNSHLQLIKQRESGGDYSAVNPSSGAAGAYQFLPSTWDAVAQQVDPSYVGVNPAKAPAAVQDKFAQHLYNTGGAGHWVTA
ncbi:transglycosylase family protein [Staphylococcus chromogenes]|uniref:transglycosylase family protein n=1 Tax=Staphylococcus chromogenes TaxID=46126 RepID=UPI00227A72CB|nr:transglycosylase family protein [Staphylococcus chromogenes]WAG30912.1 transglycosylase family protein [Staphylococcus chromogenes]